VLRPIIGDGLPQAAGLAGGALLAEEKLSGLLGNEKLSDLINILKGNQADLGFASLALGVIHLLLGGIVMI
jgi:hypothetical protein